MRLRVASVALAVIGTALSGYLTYIHYSGALALCLGAGGCETVQTSRYAEIAGLPVALLGLFAFAAVTVLAAIRLREGASDRMLTGIFGITLGGSLFALYLTYLELFVIHAICPWCVVVDSVMVALFAVTIVELRRPA